MLVREIKIALLETGQTPCALCGEREASTQFTVTGNARDEARLQMCGPCCRQFEAAMRVLFESQEWLSVSFLTKR